MSELVSEVKLASGKESFTSGRTCPDCDETIREAKLIQTSLLPTQGFRNESVDIAFRFIPFSDVGGDFVDFFRLPDGFIGIYLGDVVGKGLSAAMFAALVMGTLRGIHESGTDTARVLFLLNEHLEQRPIRGRFCSTLYALFNLSRGGTHLLQRRNATTPAGLRKRVPATWRGWVTLGNVPGFHLRTARRATRPGRLRSVRDRWSS
jgi:hypothetical protein